MDGPGVQFPWWVPSGFLWQYKDIRTVQDFCSSLPCNMFLDWIGQLWSNQSTKNSSTASTKLLFLFHNEYLAANVTCPDIPRNIMLTDKKQTFTCWTLFWNFSCMWAPKVPRPGGSWVWTWLLNSMNAEQRMKAGNRTRWRNHGMASITAFLDEWGEAIYSTASQQHGFL